MNFTPKPLKYFRIETPELDILDQQSPIYQMTNKMAVLTAEAMDRAILDEIIIAAKAEGITDLIVLDKKFIVEAIREKMEREGIKG